MKTRITLACLLALGFGMAVSSSPTTAQPVPTSQAAETQGGLNQINSTPVTTIGISEQREWQFSAFWMRINGSIGFDAPGVGSLTLVPYVELIFE
jgi:hypothetical protein